MVVPCYCCYLWTICLYLSIITTWHTSIGIIVQYNHHKISYKPRPSHAAPRSMSLFDRLSESHSQRHRLQTQSTRLYRKSVSQEFMDNVFSDKNKPIINPIRNPYVNTSPKFQPMMNEGGQLTSLGKRGIHPIAMTKRSPECNVYRVICDSSCFTIICCLSNR